MILFQISKVNDIGNLVTEITRRHEHEEFHNEDIPSSDSDEFDHIENRDGSHDYSHAKSQNYIDYLAVPRSGGKGVKVING
jgi:ABC-type Zn2+ transport system substrate-binding protein/surface adhesin